jgi:aspartate 1-decarboxylase
MLLTFLHAKLHRATITATKIDYEGSLTVDPLLLEAADMKPWQQIQVYDITNGARFETYLIEGQRGAGQIEVNGAAARLTMPGDRIIVATYVQLPPEAVAAHRPTVVLLGDGNRITGRG